MLGCRCLLVSEDESPSVVRIEAASHRLDGPLLSGEHMGPLEDAVGVWQNLLKVASCHCTLKNGEEDGNVDFLFYQIGFLFLVCGKGESHDPDAPGAVILLDCV